MIKKLLKGLFNRIFFTRMMTRIYQTQNEIVYAIKCNSTFTGSEWLKNPSFSPGNWAIGWPGLYIIYRAVNSLKPTNILEMGLGETTRMLGQYADANKSVKHLVVEHDKEWINFFDGNVRNSNIIHCDLELIKFKGKEVVRYKNFADKVTVSGKENSKYDLIVVDGPFGSKKYSRIDILDLIPEKLCKQFAIIYDDAHRVGEQATIKLIKERLKENNIEYAIGVYSGQKDTLIITSKNMKFLCSLQ